MSCHYISLKDGKKVCRPVTSSEEYKQLRSSSLQQVNLKQVRQGNQAAKQRLVQFNYSCLPNADGSLRGASVMSNSVGMDIDHLDAEELYNVTDIILSKKDELGLLMLERSARGEGLHVVFKRHAELNQEENLRWASDLLGVEYDKGAKDITRVFFATSNEPDDLLFLSDELFVQDAMFEHIPLLGNSGSTASGSAVANGTTTTARTSSSARTSGALGAIQTPTITGNPNPSGNFEPAGNHDLFGSHNASGSHNPSGSYNPSGSHNPSGNIEPSGAFAPLGSQASLEPQPSHESAEPATPLNYMGIPYRNIIAKWWQLYNDGKEPEKSNRDVLTFELAVNLRHICGFDRELMGRIIPCYDGFPLAQKMKCIDSALAERRTQMPKRIKDVLDALRGESLKTGNAMEMLAAFDEIQRADELYHYDRLPKLPQGVNDSVEAAGHALALPTLVAIAPAIGALATGVKLDVHGKAKGLNLCSIIVGEAGSGKGQMDDIIAAWMNELQTETDIYTQQEEEWASKTKRMKSGKAPEQPKLPVRMLTLNNTVANIAERLANTEGRHSFSYTPEADNVALKWKQSVSDFSVMLRQAYDEARYDREAKSADAVRVHIEKLLWNVTMCGTQDALYRVITNYTDGLLSRVCIGRTPDNTYAPLEDNPAKLEADQEERIRQIAHLLPLLHGEVVLPKLEQRGRHWLEAIRIEAMKNDDRVLARQRLRGCVNAQRMTCALFLPKVVEKLIRKHGLNGAEVQLKQHPGLWKEMLCNLQNEDMMQLFDTLADYLIDNDLYFFRSRIEQAYESKNYLAGTAGRVRKGKNDTIFARLSESFTIEQLRQQTYAEKGSGTHPNVIKQMLKNWRKHCLVEMGKDGNYHKCVTEVS